MTEMNINWPAWLLGGALAASLALHFVPTAEEAPARFIRISELGLSAQQLDLMTQRCQDCNSVGEDLEALIDDTILLLGDELAAEKVQHDVVMALAEHLGELRKKAIKNCIESILVVRDVLTPEQIEQLK